MKPLRRWGALLAAALWCAAPTAAGSAETSSVRQDIHYAAPAAGEVVLVWGVDGWGPLPPHELPAGTTVADGVMHTPMRRAGDRFIASLQVPPGARIDFGFLMTKRSTGEPVKLWDGRGTRPDDYHAIAGRAPTIRIVSQTLTPAVRSARPPLAPTAVRVAAFLFAGVLALLVLGWALTRLPAVPPTRTVGLVLAALTLVGLALRLWAIASDPRLLGDSPRLIGDEPRYDELALAMLNGQFFPWPGSPPLYPIFLWACYVLFGRVFWSVLAIQAVVASSAIPLTYALARRFTGARSALFAALITAAHPALLHHARYLYMEAVYVPLVLGALLGILRAMEQPRLGRMAAAGGWFALMTLCRPATALLPLALPFIAPGRWRWRQRMGLVAALLGILTAAAAPFAYHSWRTHGAVLPFGLSMTMLWHGSPEFYHIAQQTPNAMLAVWDHELNPAENGGHNPITIEGDRYFNERAKASIRAEPLVYAWYSLQKPAFFWVGHPAAQYDWPFDFNWLSRAFSAKEIAGLFGGRLLMALAMLWALWALRRRLWEFRLLLLLGAYLMAVHTVLVPVARYSEPLYPLVAILIAAAVSDVLRRREEPLA